jgi:hypothetical protein
MEKRIRLENEETRILANKILDRVNADPDDDLAMLSRQLLRADERIAALEEERDRLHEQFSVHDSALKSAYGKLATLRAENERLKELSPKPECLCGRSFYGHTNWNEDCPVHGTAATATRRSKATPPSTTPESPAKTWWFSRARPIINAIGEISVQEAMDAIERDL